MNLSTPIEKVPGIGDFYQKKLKKLGVKNIHDLLFYFPHRYEDFSNLVKISDIRINQKCTIKGEVKSIESSKTWKKKMIITQALIQDNSGAMKAVWFNQPYLKKIIKREDNLVLSGKVSLRDNEIYITNPVYEKYSSKEDNLIHTGRLVPIYPETAGITSRKIRSITRSALIKFKDRIPESLPEKILKENDFLKISEALWQIHFPDTEKKAKEAKKRFSFEELFLIELFVLKERIKISREKSIALPLKVDLVKRFVDSLPFKLTDAQKKSAWQILKDTEKKRPMNRLLEGDVGSGKTVVAAIAALNAAKNKYQTAFMAPTEILAKQHFKEISNSLQSFNLNIGLLTGKQDQMRSKKLRNQVIEVSRKKLLEKTLESEIDILIGTHALIQDKVKFSNLALVILDEQHRFGVEQRAKLSKKKGAIPHFLSMTATPIPRTLALTVYGDLDLSLIDELPKGRKKIKTKIVKPKEREKIYDFIRNEIEKGRQIFVICPKIEKKETNNNWSDVKSVEEEYKRLSEKIFPKKEIAMIHGKMPSKEKEKIMEKFKRKKTDILVSTSVVEVGIDIPNATVMLIEGAERFGLAQLHQFRGRVGREKHQSYCFLFTGSPSQKTYTRLKALVASEDGFSLAEKDLEMRGPGDFSGARQWGIPDLMMDSLKNIKLVEKTREKAKEILEEDPDLKEHPRLKAKLSRFGENIHLE